MDLRSIEAQIKNELKCRDMLSRIVCGGMAGIVAKTVIAPAERVKMTYQVSSESFTLKKAFYKGIDIAQKDGILSLWKGHSTTVLRVAPYAGLSYAIHDFAEREMKQFLHTEQLPIMYKFLAGSIGGFGGTVLTYPLDVLRVRLALLPNATWSSAIRHGSMYQGLVPTLLGIVPYAGMSWMVKQSLHEYYSVIYPSHPKPSIGEALVMNALAGIVAQFSTYPLDIARRRLQMAPIPSSSSRLNASNGLEQVTAGQSFIKVLRELFAVEGWKGLTKGFSLNIIKGPITLSISLTTYDMLRHWLDEGSHDQGHKSNKTDRAAHDVTIAVS